MIGYTLTCSVRLRVSSDWAALFPDKDGVDCKDILEKFMLVRSRIVEENHEFCSVEGEHILDEVEGEPAELEIGAKGLLFAW
ncbi:18129_t:CDS:2 [Rhizophagus irregularis]|nr:18129_t:CDS:2 [Rhizophagus irregularis]